MLSHDGVSDGQGSHGLDDGGGPGYHTWIMAALCGEDALARGVVLGGGLVLRDSGGRLEGDAEEDGHAVGDATLDAARVVRAGLQFRAQDAELGRLFWGDGGLGDEEGVVVPGPLHRSA